MNLMTVQRIHKLEAKAFFDKVKEQEVWKRLLLFTKKKLMVPDQIAYYMRNVYRYNFTIVEVEEYTSKSKL